MTQIAGTVASYSIADHLAKGPASAEEISTAEGINLLKNCRRAMRPGGRIIVIEMLLGEVGESGFAPFSDLNMMVMLTGQERTLAEYRGLLKLANFRLTKSSPLRPPMAMIEAVAE